MTGLGGPAERQAPDTTASSTWADRIDKDWKDWRVTWTQTHYNVQALLGDEGLTRIVFVLALTWLVIMVTRRLQREWTGNGSGSSETL
jgi:hypothetical protein